MAILRPVRVISEGPRPSANSMSVALSSDHPPLPITLSGNGPQPMASSISVTMASNQSAVPVSLAGTGAQPMANSTSVTMASNSLPFQSPSAPMANKPWLAVFLLP